MNETNLEKVSELSELFINALTEVLETSSGKYTVGEIFTALYLTAHTIYSEMISNEKD